MPTNTNLPVSQSHYASIATTACLQCYIFFCQRTPLHIAVKEGYGHTVKSLVEKGADVNMPDNKGVSTGILCY